MAAPAVTGAVALYKSTRPNATPAEVKEALQYLGNLDWKTSTDPDSYHEKLLDVSRLGPLGTFDLEHLGPRLHERARRHVADPGLASTAAARSSSASASRSPRCRPAGPRRSARPACWAGPRRRRPSPSTPRTRCRPGRTASAISATSLGRTDTGTVTVVVDNDKPIGRRARTPTSRTGTLGTSSVPVTLAWPFGSDPTSVGRRVRGRDPRSTAAPGPATRRPARATRAVTRSAALEPHTTIRVRATDGAGNWATGSRPPGPSARPSSTSAARRSATRAPGRRRPAARPRADAPRRDDARARPRRYGSPAGASRVVVPDRLEPRQRRDLGRRRPHERRVPAHAASHSRQIMMYRLLRTAARTRSS